MRDHIPRDLQLSGPEFYLRLGDETMHQIDRMPDGICKSYMLRQLSD